MFGPAWPVEDASCPSVISGRLYRCGETEPGVGYVAGPGLASRNALYAASRQSFTCAGSACFSDARGLPAFVHLQRLLQRPARGVEGLPLASAPRR